MKKHKLLITIILTIVIVACQNPTINTKDSYIPASYEISAGSKYDTINVLDTEKRKQGIWVPSPTNDLKDTLLYRNDTIISHLH
jgi:hypothetical protein